MPLAGCPTDARYGLPITTGLWLRSSCRLQFRAAVLGNHTLSAKEHPAQKAIEQFTLVHGPQNETAQIAIGQILEQEARADDPAHFAQREVQAILDSLRRIWL